MGYGSNKPRGNQERDYEAMFDDNLSTYWHGIIPVNKTTDNHYCVTFYIYIYIKGTHQFYIFFTPTSLLRPLYKSIFVIGRSKVFTVKRAK